MHLSLCVEKCVCLYMFVYLRQMYIHL
uniref:Uncharacterized protein n=1 Tax=Anguilla anguilla TaxID=7936 RepID=A0A0E9UTA0_ANGAN